MAFLIGSTEPALQRLAVPAVCILIAFLAYTSQWLFATAPDLAPGPLTTAETYTFNGLLLCLWYTYYKACTVDPGRYTFPSSVVKRKKGKNNGSDEEVDVQEAGAGEGGWRGTGQIRRWCKKCAAPKPPRAHHCKMCRRCIPKMDHHCPWTSNCVSLQTFPHFLRFLAYTNLSLWTLLYFLSQRFLALYASRHLPAYLGPTLSQLALLTVLTLVAGTTSLALGILLITTAKGWVLNMTLIESWEVERHEANLERRYDADASWWAAGERAPGGDADAPHLAAEPVEFPYDVGFLANMAAAMGTANPLLWFFPLARGPAVASNDDGRMRGAGWAYAENGLNDREAMWPPPDPDKVRHARAWRQRRREADIALAQARFERPRSPEDERAAFRRRQEHDLRRWEASRSRILGELEEMPPGFYDDYDFVDEVYDRETGTGTGTEAELQSARPFGSVVLDEGKSGWTNADGEHLGDYGVDSDAEFDETPEEEDLSGELVHSVEDDEDVPLAELIRRRKVRSKDGEDT
ncbi:zf-DHHC-domain-containing protein [Hypoxylon fuscum]|nr:zf-DHHC-domain-containing protein [Hypoxylon fuscum]